MPRIVKPPDERRNELLDCAQALFFGRGYEKTTINDVIEKAGVSKGAFYYYFSSKEEILEAIADRLARQGAAQVEGILEDPGLDALGRLNAFFARSRQLKAESAPMIRAVFDAVFRPENVVLYHRTNAAVVSVMAPVLARIIAQGIEEGTFDTPDAEGTAEMLLQLGASTQGVVARAIAATGAGEWEEAVDRLEARLRLHGIAIDRILGLPDGSVRIVEPGFVQAIMAPRSG